MITKVLSKTHYHLVLYGEDKENQITFKTIGSFLIKEADAELLLLVYTWPLEIEITNVLQAYNKRKELV